MSPQDPRHSVEDSLPTPMELRENPELGALWILRTSLEVAELSLRATYPERSERHSTEEEAYAIAILYQIDAVEALLEEYLESIRRRGEWRGRESSGEGIPF